MVDAIDPLGAPRGAPATTPVWLAQALLLGAAVATAVLVLSDQTTPTEVSPAPAREAIQADVQNAAPVAGAEIVPTPAPAAQSGAAQSGDLEAALAEPLHFGPKDIVPRIKPGRTQRAAAIVPAAPPEPRAHPQLIAASFAPVSFRAPSAPSADEAALAPLALASLHDVAETLAPRPFAGPELAPPPIVTWALVAPPSTPRAPLPVAMTADVNRMPEMRTLTVHRGDTLASILRSAQVRETDITSALTALSGVYNVRALRPGQELKITAQLPNRSLFQILSGEGGDEVQLTGLELRASIDTRIRVARTRKGLHAEKQAIPLTTRPMTVAGTIDDSLFLSARHAGAPPQVVANLANLFLFDVDFQREIRKGDVFEAVYQAVYDDEGKMVGWGDILYGRMSWRGGRESKGYYRFAAPGEDKAYYYDSSGRSARKLLMRTPIEGARISSRFGMREHPILGYTRAHKGTDFAARRGTPIMAAGDGVVERANRYGSFGNYVLIKHAAGYETAYAHLNGFARGVRKGAHVRQGQVIAYVGTTGRSTGPHLHYEVHRKGVPINPLSIKVATGRTLDGDALKAFMKERARIDALRPLETQEQRIAEKEAGGASAAL